MPVRGGGRHYLQTSAPTLQYKTQTRRALLLCSAHTTFSCFLSLELLSSISPQSGHNQCGDGQGVVRADLKDAATRSESGPGRVAPPVPPRHQHPHPGWDQTSQPGRNQTGSPAEFSLRKEFNLEFGAFRQSYFISLLFIKYREISLFFSVFLFLVFQVLPW